MVRKEIKKHMKRNRIRQKDICAKIGMTPSMFNLTLNEKRPLNAYEYAKICSALGLPMSHFIQYFDDDEFEYIKKRQPTQKILRSKSRLYRVYLNIKQRCYNPNNPKYSSYGGKGITLCDEWLNDFHSFYEWSYANGYIDPPADASKSFLNNDVLTIDRIDSTKGYNPDNCRWITFRENRNRKNHSIKKDRSCGSVVS